MEFDPNYVFDVVIDNRIDLSTRALNALDLLQHMNKHNGEGPSGHEWHYVLRVCNNVVDLHGSRTNRKELVDV